MESRENLSRLKRALDVIERLQARIDTLEAFAHEPVAIVGIGCRFPGRIDSPDSLWDSVAAGTDLVQQVPTSDPRAATLRGEGNDRGHDRYALIDGIEQFDAAFFDLSDDEALRSDPQQRLLLETTWEAIERAGYAPSSLARSDTALFVGIGSYSSDYARLQFAGADADLRTISGNVHSLIAGRVSYSLDLHGPCLAVDGACASSLVAIDLAVASLRRGECSVALAAGVNAIVTPDIARALERGGMLSPSGRCSSFDAAADGFVRSEGCGVVMLKRLRDALASRDQVLAVIRGSAVVHGGRSNGLTAPNGVAEEDVMRRALRDGAVAPREVSYIEAHATGTLLGDAVELEAIANVYGGDRESALRLGCVKTNLGHAEGAAGMAGLIKTVMAMRRGAIPPTLHFTAPNPHADLARGRCEVPATLVPWDGTRTAGVSAFGMNGTNAHVVLGEAPPVVRAEHEDREELLVLSAKTRTALSALAKRYASALGTVPLRDLCFTAAVGRTHFAHRLAIVACDASGMRAALDAFDAHYAQAGETDEGVPVSRHELRDAARAFLRGASIDFDTLYRDDDVRRVALPTYPFEKKPYWIENGAAWSEWIYAPEWVEIANARGAAESIVFEATDEPEEVQCARLLALVREEAARETPRRLVIVTRHSSGATLRGMAAVIALEHPELRCKHVEVANEDVALSLECAADDDEQDVRLADGRRFARRLHRATVPAEHRPLFRSDGTYVIAGGTGAIGRRIAKWLTERGAGRIALLSRRGEPVDGFEVRRCDVADRDALREVLAGIDNLRGVIHAAGVVSDRLLAHENEEHLAEVFRAKVDGARNLHELTIDTPLDCFILFSSVTSLLGLTGAGAYAAANAALDTLAQHRRDRGLPALSVNWAAWRGLGMAEAGRDERRENAWRAHGIDSFAAEDGLAFLDAALASTHAQLAFLPADWNAHLLHFRSGYVPPLLRDLVQPVHPRATTADRDPVRTGLPARLTAERTENGRRDLLLRFVADSAARVVGRPHERLDPRRPLTELGVDSLGAIELRNLISIALDRTLPATLVYNHPTIEALARHLARITEAPRLPIRRAAAAAIETLTDDDAEILLEEAIDAWAEAKPRG